MKILVVEPLIKPYVIDEDLDAAIVKYIDGMSDSILLEPYVEARFDAECKIKRLKGNRRIKNQTRDEMIAGTFLIYGWNPDNADSAEEGEMSLTEKQIEKYSKLFENIEIITDEEVEASLLETATTIEAF